MAEGGGVGGEGAEVGGHEAACATRFDCCCGFGRFEIVRLGRMEFGLIPSAECVGEPVQGTAEESFSTAAQAVGDEIVELRVGEYYALPFKVFIYSIIGISLDTFLFTFAIDVFKREMVVEEAEDYAVEKVVGSCDEGLAMDKVIDAKQAQKISATDCCTTIADYRIGEPIFRLSKPTDRIRAAAGFKLCQQLRALIEKR